MSYIAVDLRPYRADAGKEIKPEVEIDQYRQEPEKIFFALCTKTNELISKGGILLTGTSEQWAQLLGGTTIKYRLINCRIVLPTNTHPLESVYPGLFGRDKLGRS